MSGQSILNPAPERPWEIPSLLTAFDSPSLMVPNDIGTVPDPAALLYIRNVTFAILYLVSHFHLAQIDTPAGHS